MSERNVYDPSVEWVRREIRKTGCNIGSVWFIKSNGELRKMSFRLHTRHPSIAKTPKGILLADSYSKGSGNNYSDKGYDKTKRTRSEVDRCNSQLTVLDVNVVVRDENGKIKGRGAWKTIKLFNVTRICVKGEIINIKRTQF